MLIQYYFLKARLYLSSQNRWLWLTNTLGGGQPSDQGRVLPLPTASFEPIPIASVQREGLRCIYYSPKPLLPGSQVRQEVDFRRRWDHMQQHTGQHLLSAIMDTYDNLETLGWGMGSDGDMYYVDLPRKPSEEEIQAIQDKCNKTIRNNLQIIVETPNDAEVDSLPGDYDKDKGVIRVVRIGDLDRNTYVHLDLIFLATNIALPDAAVLTFLRLRTSPSFCYIILNQSTLRTIVCISQQETELSNSPEHLSTLSALLRDYCHLEVPLMK